MKHGILLICSKKKISGIQVVFTIKYKPNGLIEWYKAKLVAKGYTQAYGIDYQETFALVAKMNFVRVLLSLTANLDWPLQKFDVKNVFLHGNLEEVFMDLPLGFEGKFSSEKDCRLKKSLYGLKQSSRAWFERYAKFLLKFGYHQSQGNHTLFIKQSPEKKITALIVCVDDIIVTRDDVEEMQNLKLAKEFDIKDLGNLRYFLGIEVARSKRGIYVTQRKYILNLLNETGMLWCKPVGTPINQNHQLDFMTEGIPVDKGRYQRLVGRLIYLSHTRPDIAYAISMVSQFMHSPL